MRKLSRMWPRQSVILLLLFLGGCKNDTPPIDIITPLLSVSEGAHNPDETTVTPGNTDVVALQFVTVDESSEVVQIKSFTFSIIGDVQAVDALRLCRDDDANGIPDEGDTGLGTAQQPGETGNVVFAGTSELIAQNASVSYLVTVDVNSEAESGQSFIVALLNPDTSLEAMGTTNNVDAIISGGSIFGSSGTVVQLGSVVLAAGSGNPPSSIEKPDASGVVMLQFAAIAGEGESVNVTSATVTATGTADSATAISSAYLYLDKNRNGVVDRETDELLS